MSKSHNILHLRSICLNDNNSITDNDDDHENYGSYFGKILQPF